ncbi:OPT oligopeptide transporter [Sarocladium strictum]
MERTVNVSEPEAVAVEHAIEQQLNVTEDDFLEAREVAATLTLEVTRKHQELIHEMKLETALITNNSPYDEVRAVVDNKDDPRMPCATIRAWVIGTAFSIAIAFVNQLFSVRQPAIYIESNIAQLLAYPLGKAWERWIPAWELKLFGQAHSLNPGRLNKKEHMLIAIMANTAKSFPYTAAIILIALSTNFIGYGLAGLTRRFIVYPSYCLWPASLVTIALNSALHYDDNWAVPGPFKRVFNMSRYKLFLWSFGAMFIYFWFPNYVMQILTFFSWMTWIAPENTNLNILTGFQTGLGLVNPWPTFDWNVLMFDQIDPLMVPAFSTFNRTLDMFLFGVLFIVQIYYTNTWNASYIPTTSNRVLDHFGQIYNVSRAVDARGFFDHGKYMDYSAAYLSASNTITCGAFFNLYLAAVTHVALFRRHELSMGFKSLWISIRRKETTTESVEGEYEDIHNRLMALYPEVSGWWYLATLLIAVGLGFVGICAWPTYTTPGVIPFGVALAIVFVIPIGIIKAMTGIEVTLNVLAEFIGGMWVEGNALAMNYFKTFGYVTCAHALHFANDLKVAHYLKIPPRHTFAAQMIATLISTFVCTGVLKFQVEIPNVCTPEAPMRFFCPGPNTFFTSSVLWSTIGPVKLFGHEGQYKELLLGFPLGVVSVLVYYLATRWAPRNQYLRQIHPVAMWFGGVNWSPYSFSYPWPSVPIAWLSWIYVKKRHLALWSKYNFVLSASFSAAIAIASIVMLLTVGCEGVACTRCVVEEGEHFTPWWNPDKVAAPGL